MPQHSPDITLHNLVACAQDGDRGAAGKVLSWMQDPVRALVRRILPEGDVEDAVQDSLLKIFVALPRFDRSRKVRFQTWCHTIAVNHCRDLLRRKRSTGVVSHVGVPQAEDPLLEPSRTASGRELLERYDRAVDDLPRGQRELLELREKGGLTYRQLGEKFGVPIGTIRARLSRMRRKLREQVDRTELEGAIA